MSKFSYGKYLRPCGELTKHLCIGLKNILVCIQIVGIMIRDWNIVTVNKLLEVMGFAYVMERHDKSLNELNSRD